MKRFVVLVVFAAFSAITTQLLWIRFGWPVLFQIMFILIIAAAGECMVSSRGYYHYTAKDYNGPFLRNVPLWIMYLWIFSIHCSFLIPLVVGLPVPAAVLASGVLAFAADIIIIEPLLSRVVNLWTWTPVDDGYFSFIPRRLNRFTAPPGNYVVWFGFPIVANGLMVFLFLMLV